VLVCVVCSSSTSAASGGGDNSSCQEHPQANWRRMGRGEEEGGRGKDRAIEE